MVKQYVRLMLVSLLLALAACTDSSVDPLENTAMPNDKTWQWQHPPIPSNYLNDVWADPSGTVFAVGEAGTILRRQDGVWAPMNAHVDVRLRGVHGSSPDNVIAVGDHGTIMRFNGRYWFPMDSGTNTDLERVWVHSSGVAAAVGDGSLMNYRDGTWSYVGGHDMKDVWGSSPDNIYAVGAYELSSQPPHETGTVVHFDGGRWRARPPPSDFGGLWHIWGAGPNDMYVVADIVDSLIFRGTRLYHYDGSTWTLHDSLYVRDVWGRSANDIFALGGPTYHFNGQTWSPLSCDEIGLDHVNGTATEIISVGRRIASYDGVTCEIALDNYASFRDVWGAASDDVYAVSTSGMMHYDGTSWQTLDVGWEGSIYSIDGRSATDIIVGVIGGTLHYDGAGWTHTSFGPFDRVVSDVWVDPSTPAVYALGSDSVFAFDGEAWKGDELPTLEMYGRSSLAIWGAATDDVFAVGFFGAITHFDGSAWTLMSSEPRRLFSVWGSAGDDVYAGARGGIMHYDGESWSLRYPLFSQEMRGVWGDGNGDVFGVGEFGNIVHITPNQVRYFPHRTNNELNGVWGSSADDVFAVGRNGTILRYGR